MMRATHLGTIALALSGIVLGSRAAPVRACDPAGATMVAADAVTKAGPLVLQIDCGDECPETAPGVKLVDAQGQEHPGVAADYVISGHAAFVRWQPDAELEEGADYTVRCDDPAVYLAEPALTRVVAVAPVFQPDGAVFGLQAGRRKEGLTYCCGEDNGCGVRPCFGELGSLTLGVASATANAPSTHTARLRRKGTPGDEVSWAPPRWSASYVFDAAADELCVVLEVWDLARDEKRELEHCFTERVEGLGEVELGMA